MTSRPCSVLQPSPDLSTGNSAAKVLRVTEIRQALIPAQSCRQVRCGRETGSHCHGDITSHYLIPEIEELLTAVNRVCWSKSGNDFAENKNRLEGNL